MKRAGVSAAALTAGVLAVALSAPAVAGDWRVDAEAQAERQWTRIAFALEATAGRCPPGLARINRAVLHSDSSLLPLKVAGEDRCVVRIDGITRSQAVVIGAFELAGARDARHDLAKLILRIGAREAHAEVMRPTGASFELVPDRDPTRANGEIGICAYADGQPQSGVAVRATQGRARRTRRTGDDGCALFAVTASLPQHYSAERRAAARTRVTATLTVPVSPAPPVAASGASAMRSN